MKTPLQPKSWQALLEQSKRVPWDHRTRQFLSSLRNNGVVQFIIVFSLFVLVGTLIEYLLEGRIEGSPFADFFQAFWFTVVTITTVGYGDMSPSTPMAQIWAMVEMMVGIGLVGIITGNMASVLVERNRKRALGLVPLTKLKGHTIICGWKIDMREILLGILEANPLLTAADLVLVATHQSAEIGELRRDSRLRHLKFVFGSHTDRSVLSMARVQTADRVIILAEETGHHDRDAADSRTVLAATTVETLNPVVYTCTEIIQPHFARYLRQARVEEVVMGSENIRSLVAAASLGLGVSNTVTRFFPENGGQLRVFPVPHRLTGKTYGELAGHYRGQGLLPVGLLDNTGNLFERKRERLTAALKKPDYTEAIKTLGTVSRLYSNIPHIAPDPATVVSEYCMGLVLLPASSHQTKAEMERRGSQKPEPWLENGEHLAICGWKRDMAGLLGKIRKIHQALGRPVPQLTVISRMPDDETKGIAQDPELADVRLVHGQPTDPASLEQAGIEEVGRVVVLIDSGADLRGQEADARNVMTSIAINSINPKAYKCVEISNPDFSEHLNMASVEEIIYTRRYQQVMLVQASQGTGLSHAIRALMEPTKPVMRVVDFPSAPATATFGEFEQTFEKLGYTLIGVLDHCGNNHNRKQEFLYQAQVQPSIKNSIDHLLRLKTIVSNRPIFNPPVDFLPGTHSRAVVLAPEKESKNNG